MAKTNPGILKEGLAEELPWLTWMPPEEQLGCLSDIITQLAAGAKTGTFQTLRTCPYRMASHRRGMGRPRTGEAFELRLPGRRR